MRWTPDALPDLRGRLAVVTGANSGLGLRVSTHLARRGATVVMACRDLGRGAAALERLRAEVAATGDELTGGGPVHAEVARLDLADLDDVRRFAVETPSLDRGIDLLVNNAGVMAVPHRTSAQGHELQLAVNHLGHFALTGLLLARLTPTARVVSVSSNVHRQGRLHRDDLMLTRSYAPWVAYGQSKLADLLFIAELQRRLETHGSGVRALAAHPGYAATSLVENGPGAGRGRWLSIASSWAARVIGQSDEQGAWPLLRAATDPQAQGGAYFGPGGLGQMRGAPVPVDRSPQAQDLDDARWLWERSEELTGVRYL